MNYLYCSLEREGVEGVEGVEKVEGLEGVEGLEEGEGLEGGIETIEIPHRHYGVIFVISYIPAFR